MSNNFEQVPALGLSLGIGYNLIKVSPTLYSALTPISAATTASDAPSIGFRASIATSDGSNFSLDAIAVAARVRANVFNGKLQSSMQWITQKDEHRLNVEISIVIREPAPTPKDVYIRADVAKLLKNNNVDQFENLYGTHAVVGFYQESTLTISFVSKTIQQKKLFDLIASLSASVKTIAFGGSLDANYQQATSELLKCASHDLNLSADGFDLRSLNINSPSSDPDKFFEWSLSTLKTLLGAPRQPVNRVAILVPYSSMQIEKSEKSGVSRDTTMTSDILDLYMSLIVWQPRLRVLIGIVNNEPKYDYLVDSDRQKLVAQFDTVKAHVDALLTAAEDMRNNPHTSVPESLDTLTELLYTLPWPDPQVEMIKLCFAEDNSTKYYAVELQLSGGKAEWVRTLPVRGSTVVEMVNYPGLYTGSMRQLKTEDNDDLKKYNLLLRNIFPRKAAVRLTYHYNSLGPPSGSIRVEWVHPQYAEAGSRGEAVVFASTEFPAV